MDADFSPKVLLHRSDVKQISTVKEEAPVDHRPCADLHDPNLHHIKEEEEEVYTSLEGELLSWKEEVDATRFPVTAAPIKSEDDEQSPLVSQLHPNQIKGRELPEGNHGGGESIRIQEQEGCPFFSVTEKEDNDVKDHVPEPVNSTGSALKTEDMDNAWMEDRAPQSDGNASSECECGFFQKDTMNSQMGSSSSVDANKCLTEKQNVDQQSKVQTGEKLRSENSTKTFTQKLCCDLCEQRFTKNIHLKKHMRLHTGQKALCCDICGQEFNHKGTLNRHKKIHTGQKAFCCDQCGQSLTPHMRIHTGQKPFSCALCGNSFRGRQSFTRHMRIHTGQKPVCCDLYGHRFTRKEHLNQHMNIHTGKNPFSCGLCGGSFGDKRSLNKHMRIHIEQEPF